MTTDNPVGLGPFSGGLNQLDDPRSIGDNECAILQNFDIRQTGDLRLRSGLRLVRGNELTAYFQGFGGVTRYAIGVATKADGTPRMYMLEDNNSTFGQGNFGYAFAEGSNITSTTYTWTLFDSGQVLSSNFGIAYGGRTVKLVQYSGYAYFVPKDVSDRNGASTTAVGFRHSLTNNDGVPITSDAILGMPRGSGALISKDRMFIFGPLDNKNSATSRIYYSASTDPTTWPANNFFDVNPGDGEGVTAAFVVSDYIVIFKKHSTYILTYSGDPGLGTLRKISDTIGCTGPEAVKQLENALYFLDERTAYRLQNYVFTDIGKNLNIQGQRTTLIFGFQTQDFVYTWGTRVVYAVYVGGNIPYKYYCYHTEVTAWTEYTFASQPNRFFKVSNTTSLEDIVSTKLNARQHFVQKPFSVLPADFGDGTTMITPFTLKTKSFTWGNFTAYKRLFWWGLSVATTGKVIMKCYADTVASVADEIVGTGLVAFLKSYTSQRGRYFSFSIDNSTNITPNQQVNILSGIAFIKEKRTVSVDVTP